MTGNLLSLLQFSMHAKSVAALVELELAIARRVQANELLVDLNQTVEQSVLAMQQVT
jgi:hypothetical protein